MSERDVISDELWRRIEPLLPSMAPQRGGRWVEHRKVLEGIAFRFRTGVPWRDVPDRFGSWNTLHKRHSRWADDGTYARLHQHLLGEADKAGELDWLVSVDSTIVRAHQHAAGARREGQGSLDGHTGRTSEDQRHMTVVLTASALVSGLSPRSRRKSCRHTTLRVALDQALPTAIDLSAAHAVEREAGEVMSRAVVTRPPDGSTAFSQVNAAVPLLVCS